MDGCRFKLSGKTAFFKNPEVNTYLYYSYGHIPRVTLLGLLGAILGYKGYNEEEREGHPEFYKKLDLLPISIVPNTEDGIYPRKLQTFNNSTGLASNEAGGNLIVKQVWLEDVSWDIYFKLENQTALELANRLKNHKATYIPYLGTNDHMATISDVKEISLIKGTTFSVLDSLFLKEDFITQIDVDTFRYEEYLPFALEENTERYKTKKFVYTNELIKKEGKNSNQVYYDKELNRHLVFYTGEGIYEN